MVRNKLKYCLLLIFFEFAFCQLPFAQTNKTIDSLMNVLKITREDTNKVNTLIKLSDKFRQLYEFEESKNYADTAVQLSERLNFKHGKANSYLLIGLNWGKLANYPEALRNLSISLKIMEETSDRNGVADCYNGMAQAYKNLGNNDEALKNYIMAIGIYNETGSKNGLSQTYSNIGLVYWNRGNYAEAVKNYLASLRMSEETGNKKAMAQAYNNIGIIYDDQGKVDEALKNYKASLKIAEEINNKYGIAICNINIGIIYSDKGDQTEALECHLASLKIFDEIGAKMESATAYICIGGDYEKLGNNQEALKNYLDGLKIAKEIGDKATMASAYNGTGEVSINLKKYTEAKNYLINGLMLAKQSGNIEQIKNAYGFMSKLDSATGNFESALMHFKLFSDYKDSILNESNNKSIAQMKEEYESERKDKTLEIVNKEKNIQALQLKKQKQSKKYFIAGLGLLAILSFFVFRNFQNQRKLNKLYKISAEKQMAELQLQSLRAQLNPHFMFNSLNAIQELIVMEENEKSQSYLERFAQLLRQLLENANQPFIPLRKEIGFLDLYLSLEKLRLPDLKYSIELDPQINAESFIIPNMMLQPYIENALWHGLQHKQGEKKLQLHISRQNGTLQYEIKDNGVGRKKAEEYKSLYRKEHRSKGMELLSQRFDLLSQEYGQTIQTKVTDLTENGNAAGTLVEIIVPVSISEQNNLT